jgi:hypothetical protein
MNMKLDAFDVDFDTKDLTYELPAPFGPKRGPAFIKIKARPVSPNDSSFTRKAEKIAKQALLLDRRRESALKGGISDSDYIDLGIKNAEKITQSISTLNYDHCVIDWETNIQSDGKDLEATRENFIGLSLHPNKTLKDVMERFNEDLSDLSNWRRSDEEAIEEQEAKN